MIVSLELNFNALFIFKTMTCYKQHKTKQRSNKNQITKLYFDEKKINILDKDFFTICDLIHADLEVKESKAIILDGVDFELRVIGQGRTNIYHWRTEEQISSKTKDLIEKLVDVAGLQQYICARRG